jgi:hypothetical protein
LLTSAKHPLIVAASRGDNGHGFVPGPRAPL